MSRSFNLGTIAAGTSVFLSLGACVSSADGQERQSAEDQANLPLSDDELVILLSNVNVTHPRDHELHISHPPAEIFEEEGIYFEVDGRITREGNFEITDDQVCVRGPTIDDRCRRVFRSTGGTYIFVDSKNAFEEVLLIEPR